MPIDVRIEGADALGVESAAWRRARTEFAARLVTESRSFGSEAVRQAQNKYLSGPRPQHLASRGGLRGSVVFEVDTDDETVQTTVGTNMEYARAWEYGRPPGSFPPIEPLANWARLRLGVPAREARSVGFLIARRIFLEGQEPRPFLYPATRDTLPGYESSIKRILGEIPFRD